MNNQPTKFTCPTCGHSWLKGRDGNHDCTTRLKKTIDLQAACITVLEKVLKETQWHLRKSPAITDTVWSKTRNATLYELIQEVLDNTTPPAAGDETEPAPGEWWMLKSPDTLRMSPMVFTGNGWGSILNSEGKAITNFISKRESLIPLYRMTAAQPQQHRGR